MGGNRLAAKRAPVVSIVKRVAARAVWCLSNGSNRHVCAIARTASLYVHLVAWCSYGQFERS